MTNGANELALHAEAPPLRTDDGDVIRVGNSRVSLDVVIEQYENGMTPEDIVRGYDSLTLADVHAVIAYYLRHRADVRSYLDRRMQEAESLRDRIEANHPRVTKEKLLACRSVGVTADAAAGK
jgi:uncharacterized protein (DUF433 family)